jgi:hypothetical protein
MTTTITIDNTSSMDASDNGRFRRRTIAMTDDCDDGRLRRWTISTTDNTSTMDNSSTMDDLSTMDDSYTMDNTFMMDKLVDSDGQLQSWTWSDGWFRERVQGAGGWRER